MYQTIRNLLEGSDFTIQDSFELPGREARYDKVPRFLFDSESPVGPHLEQAYPSGLWAHQSQALEAFGRGENVVVSTGTASGKSLIFQAAAFHKTLLDPTSRVAVFYPMKALVSDQLRSWRGLAQRLGLDEGVVGQIDGSVNVRDRDAIIQQARIVIMTPDVCHAWMMSRLAMPVIRNFVGALSIVVMDEAHSLEGVFGSNFAFLCRRLIAAQSHILGRAAASHKLQLIGSTATIASPDDHLKRLTGTDFSVVDHTTDGAPTHLRVIVHIVCAEKDASQIAREIQTRLLTEATQGSFITFIDSRQGAEALAMDVHRSLEQLTAASNVAPYRAGLSAENRRRIEAGLRNGSFQGVVSTAALELGIDIPRLTVGLNIGLPLSRKSYRQRLGRIGRGGPGAFVMIGPADMFSKFGASLREYDAMSVEPSYLYLDNRFMQFAQARCLSEERDSLKAPSRLPDLQWPSEFEEIYSQARPEGNRLPEFDAIAELGADTPHYNYALRNVGEITYDIKRHDHDSSLGDISHSQALREAYPGGTYRHGGSAYEIQAWNTFGTAPYIRVKQTSPYRVTRPRITTRINAEITTAGLMAGNLVNGDRGFLAECQMLITHRVVGYLDGKGQFNSYQEMRQTNPRMQTYSRNFRTSGIVFSIEEEWFKKDNFKKDFSDRLHEVFVHEFSIDPRDVGVAATNISVRGFGGHLTHTSCVVVYDETYGSLRLTEKLYRNFAHTLEQMVATEQDAEFRTKLTQVKSLFAEFAKGESVLASDTPTPFGYEQVFAKDSVVCFRERGQVGRDVKIIAPRVGDDGTLMYRIESFAKPGQPSIRVSVPAARIEPSANSDAWEYVWWNRATEEYEDLPEEADGEEG